MEPLGPPELIQQVAEFAACIGAQRWAELTAFFHPMYQSCRGAGRWLSAQEEITYLRREISSPRFKRTVCYLTPRAVRAAVDGADVRVDERLELTSPDGCIQVKVRQFDQKWHCAGANWLLVRSEELPRTERCYREAALSAWRSQRLMAAENLCDPLGTGTISTLLTRLFTRRAVAILRPLLPLPRLTVAVDTGAAPQYASEALRRACQGAMEAWNASLHNVIELSEASGQGHADILVRAWHRPIPGRAKGVTIYGGTAQHGSQRALLAELRVALVERTSAAAPCRSPVELFMTVCHELGHCFGLGECSHVGHVMGPRWFTTEVPSGLFLAERYAIIRSLTACHSLLARAYHQLGRDGLAEAHAHRAEGVRAEVYRKPAEPAPFSFALLDDTAYAPSAVRHYWEGSAHLRRGDIEGALSSYDQALADAPAYPEVLLRRGWVRFSRDGELCDLRRSVAAAPTWLTAREYLLLALKHSGRTREAEAEGALVRRMLCHANLEQRLFSASLLRSPWARSVAFLGVAGYTMQYAAMVLRENAMPRRK
jgi:tetratricopeptide (TPR) repeat protein